MRLRTRYTQRLPVAPGLRLDIPFFEGSGTKVLDVSGKGNHGTITDAVWTRDENGVAMTFNGTSAYIDCGNDASLAITDAITVEVWVKINDISCSYCGIARNATGGLWIGGWTLSTGGSGVDIRFTINHYNTNKAYMPMIDTNWHHIVGTYDKTLASANIKIFLDGVLTGVTDDYTGDIGTGNPTQIGISDYYYNGTIDEVRIYAVALTAEQIKRRYEQTKRDYVRAS